MKYILFRLFRVTLILGYIAYCIAAIYSILYGISNEDSVSHYLLLALIFTILISSLILRRKLFFKSFVLNDKNFLFAKSEITITLQIQDVFLFDKLLEVVKDSTFYPIDSERNHLQLLVTTNPNFISWNDTMYIEIINRKNQISEIKLTSASLFGYRWKTNKKNFYKFYQLLKESLIKDLSSEEIKKFEVKLITF